MMQHKIVIANSKTANCGKSTSIRYAFEELRSRYIAHVLEPTTGYDSHQDVKAIIEIPQEDGNIVKVGVESQGDPNSRQGKSIADFEQQGCEIILVACRTRRTTLSNVTNLRSNYWQVIWFDNSTMWVDSANNRSDVSGTRLDKQDRKLQDQFSRDYGIYVASLIEQLVRNEGNL